MQDDVTRLLGIEGMAVTGVADHGWWIELAVELLAGAGCCRWCGRGSLVLKERDRMRVRDLPFAGRMTYLLWRKRRCDARDASGRSPRLIRSCPRASGSAPASRVDPVLRRSRAHQRPRGHVHAYARST